MKRNLTFEDLENALMFISFDTVDEDGAVERETLAYSYADGKLKYYTLDADGIVFDATFDPADHDISKVTTYDYAPADYDDATALVMAILKHEGREIINEAPANEWDIVDNKVNIVVYNAEREKVAEHSWAGRAKKKLAPKYGDDGYPIEMTEEEKKEAFERSLNATMEADERNFRRDRRRLGLYILLLLATSALFGWLAWRDDLTTLGIWLVGLLSGLYITQIVWCNFGGAPLGVNKVKERRAKGRPWINGGFIVAIVMSTLCCFLDGMNLASSILLGEIIGVGITFIWRVVSGPHEEHPWLAKMAPGWHDTIERFDRKWERKEVRDFYAEIFKRMFWLD